MSNAITRAAEQVLAKMVADSADGIWQGSTTALVSEIAHSSYYSHVMRLLEDLGAVKMVHRGGGGKPTQWQIVNPSPDFESIEVSRPQPIGQQRRSSVHLRLEALESALSGIDVPKALTDLALAMNDLREKVEEVEARCLEGKGQ